ncbi:hypothetical protein [Mycolicibacterium palauense]|uniref:hypothetical protein n=1 Tax=Mycolicibacterium palauense TaxID=2034511 RepID=UPI0011453884|nr:hypothetical protein [Mycolicibacterium palauense]
MLIDDEIVITAAVLLAAGTLATAIDALTAHPRRMLLAAGKVLWCLSGLLAIVAFAMSVGRLTIDTLPGGSILAVVGGACVATAAVLLLRLFGCGPRVSRPEEQRGQHEQRRSEPQTE